MNETYLFLVSAVSMIVGVWLTWQAFKISVKVKTWIASIEQLADSAVQIKTTLAGLSNTSAMSEDIVVKVTHSAAIVKQNAESLQQCVQVLQQLVAAQPLDPEPAYQSAMPQSLNDLTYSFTKIEKDLLAQGIDPETAKYKAAEYELDRIAGGDISEISMSL